MMQYLIVGLIFFASYVVSSVSGFGASVLGLPILALVVGLGAAKQSMVVLGLVLYAIMTVRCWDEVDLRELKRILLLASPGLLVGMLACQYLPAKLSEMLLGVFVLYVALRGLIGGGSGHASSAPNWLGRVMLFMGGLVHGAFTTGGPLVVVYCQKALPEKSTFRATLGAMWLLMGSALVIQWTLSGAWDANAMRVSLLGLPFLFAGMMGGEYLHSRVDAKTFSVAVHLTLLATGGVLVWSAVR